MRILGIDPGYAIIGWGVLDYKGNKFSVVDYGSHHHAGQNAVSFAAANDLHGYDRPV